jgi:hypothetical protein
MAIALPAATIIVNDAYRPTPSDKHPRSLGAPTAELWAEIWDEVGAQEACRLAGRSAGPAVIHTPKPLGGEMPETPRDGYSTLVSFSTMEEADVAAAALRAGGVPALIGNQHSASMSWTMVTAMGGIQLLVPTGMLAEAQALLHERIALESADGDELDERDYEPSKRKDRWKAQILLLWILGPFVLILGLSAFRGWVRIVMHMLGS